MQSEAHASDDSKRSSRIKQACTGCGQRRVKCDGKLPCQQCTRLGQECLYRQPKKRGPPKGSVRSARALQFATFEQAFTDRNGSSYTSSSSHAVTPSVDSPAADHHLKRKSPSYAPEDRNGRLAPSFTTQDHSSRNDYPSHANWVEPVQHHSISHHHIQNDYDRGLFIPPSERVRPPSHRGVPARPNFSLPPADGEIRPHTATYQQGSNYSYQADMSGDSMPLSYIGSSSGSGVPSTVSTPAQHRSPSDADNRPPSQSAHMYSSYHRPYRGESSGIGLFESPKRTLPPLTFPTTENRSRMRDNTGPYPLAATSARGAERRYSHVDPIKSLLDLPGATTSSSTGGRRNVGDHRTFDTSARNDSAIPLHSNARPQNDELFATSAVRKLDRERRARHPDDSSRDLPGPLLGNPQEASKLSVSQLDKSPLHVITLLNEHDHAPTPQFINVTLTEPVLPRSVYDHLWQTFGSVIHIHWPILYLPSLKPEGIYFSVDEDTHPLLFNSICSLAASTSDGTLHDKDGDLPFKLDGQQLSSLFHARAKFYLLRTMMEPSLETIQSLVFLSLRENGAGRPVAADQYSSSACRMALDLGLHRDADAARALGADLTKAEIQARRRVLWLCYILDKTSAAALGRPPVLRDVEIDTPYPDTDEIEEHTIWARSARWLFDANANIEHLRNTPAAAISTFINGGKLAVVAEKIIENYNIVKSKLDPEERDQPWAVRVRKIHLMLEAWRENTPAHLDWTEPQNRLPHILLQHLWYNCLRIVLHRPYILRPVEEHNMPDLPSSQSVCTDATGQICALLDEYGKVFSKRKLSSTFVYVLFTCSTVLLANITSSDPEVAEMAKGRLRKCLRWLSQISATWSSAGHHLGILTQLAQRLLRACGAPGLEGSSAANGRGAEGDDARADMHADAGASQRSISSESDDALFLQVLNDAGSSLAGPIHFTDTSGVNAAVPNGMNDVGQQQQAGMTLASAGVDQEDLLRLHDAAYWGAMPLSSEEPLAWRSFASGYSDAVVALSERSNVPVPVPEVWPSMALPALGGELATLAQQQPRILPTSNVGTSSVHAQADGSSGDGSIVGQPHIYTYAQPLAAQSQHLPPLQSGSGVLDNH